MDIYLDLAHGILSLIRNIANLPSTIILDFLKISHAQLYLVFGLIKRNTPLPLFLFSFIFFLDHQFLQQEAREHVRPAKVMKCKNPQMMTKSKDNCITGPRD